jgi:hypothetical protein
MQPSYGICSPIKKPTEHHKNISQSPLDKPIRARGIPKDPLSRQRVCCLSFLYLIGGSSTTCHIVPQHIV